MGVTTLSFWGQWRHRLRDLSTDRQRFSIGDKTILNGYGDIRFQTLDTCKFWYVNGRAHISIVLLEKSFLVYHDTGKTCSKFSEKFLKLSPWSTVK